MRKIRRQTTTLTPIGVGSILVTMFLPEVTPFWVQALGLTAGIALIGIGVWPLLSRFAKSRLVIRSPRKPLVREGISFFERPANAALPDVVGGNVRWDSAQAAAWIVLRDDDKIKDVASVDIKAREWTYDVKEAMQVIELTNKLGFADNSPVIDNAAREIGAAARNGEISARGRRDKSSATEAIDPAEWINTILNPYVGRLTRDDNNQYPVGIWHDVTFQAAEIKKRWPAAQHESA